MNFLTVSPLGLPILLTVAAACQAQPAIDVRLTVDFGQDLGQNFGTLFEGRDKDGRLVFGAGFASVYNSYFRAERYKVQFFVRPRKDADAYAIAPLPRATADSGVYLFDLRDQVYARPSGNDYNALKRWDASNGQWQPASADLCSAKSAALVRGRRLELSAGRLLYDGKTILDPPQKGGYMLPYYGQGHLFFYHRLDSKTEPSFNRIYAVPWSPYGEGKVDLSAAKALDVTLIAEFPYAYGQLGNEVLNCSNWGGLYAFDGAQWKVLRKVDPTTSYQIYSMITYGDRLLMAQYPTGFLFEYDGKNVTLREGWPPVPPGAASRPREAQTTMIYRGELLVGVWPWAELWRLDPDAQRWVAMGRLFTHPKVHETPPHPYEDQMKAAGLVINLLGQRLGSMVPLGDALLMSTSSKGGHTWGTEKDCMDAKQRDEYGAIHRLHMPGNLAAALQWTDKTVNLRFVAKDGRMAIFQDDREVAA
ncbi:MAG: hypothetical protein FJ279_28215, partial [Planctomycetes bacterium]|nr:hypothetical protein [Planctomycetota bacterium]